jgi:hypothetical protein
MNNSNRYAPALPQTKRVESALEMIDETLEHTEKIFVLATAIVQELQAPESETEGKDCDDFGKYMAHTLAKVLVDVISDGEGGQLGRIRECLVAMQGDGGANG